MANDRMALAMVANELRALSKRVEDGFAQVGDRFAQVDERFAQVDARFAQVDARFEQFADKIITAFKINLERMEAKLDAALDDTREQKRRLDAFERRNTEEHRLMQAQIDDLDARLPPRRRPRRPS
jgi:septation ring formation regulator EzrA